MPYDPPAKRQKIGLGSSIPRALDETRELFKPRSKSTSQQLFGASSSRAHSPVLSGTSRILDPDFLVKRPSCANVSVHASASSTTGIIGDTTRAVDVENHPIANSNNWSRARTGLEAALQGLHLTTRIFPPLQSAIGILISCLELVQVIARFLDYHPVTNLNGSSSVSVHHP